MGLDKNKRGILTPEVADGISGVKAISVTLTAAQLAAMHTTPVNIIPAQGAGICIVIETVIFKMIATSTAYTGGGAVNLQYHTSPNAVPHSGTVPASVVTTATPGSSFSFMDGASGTNALLVPANDGVDITNASGAFAVGTGTALVYVVYRKMKL